jgi:hypothetical protein
VRCCTTRRRLRSTCACSRTLESQWIAKRCRRGGTAGAGAPVSRLESQIAYRASRANKIGDVMKEQDVEQLSKLRD